MNEETPQQNPVEAPVQESTTNISPDPSSEKKSKKKLILIVLAVIVLLGGAAFAWNTMRKPAAEPEVKTTTEETTETEAETNIATDPYAGWKTYTSPLSGYTIKYPTDWVITAAGTKAEVFTNNNGGKSNNFTLHSVKRTGSYSGEDANTYLCVDFGEYTKTGWSRAEQPRKNPVVLGSFKPNSSSSLDIMYDKAAEPMLGYLYLRQGSSPWVSLSSQYELRVDSSFNCVQGDSTAIQNSKEDMLERPEVEKAQLIMKSLQFN